MLTKAEIMQKHRFAYQGVIAALPGYDKTELEYLLANGWTRAQIWEYAPGLAEDADWKAPDWY